MRPTVSIKIKHKRLRKILLGCGFLLFCAGISLLASYFYTREQVIIPNEKKILKTYWENELNPFVQKTTDILQRYLNIRDEQNKEVKLPILIAKITTLATDSQALQTSLPTVQANFPAIKNFQPERSEAEKYFFNFQEIPIIKLANLDVIANYYSLQEKFSNYTRELYQKSQTAQNINDFKYLLKLQQTSREAIEQQIVALSALEVTNEYKDLQAQVIALAQLLSNYLAQAQQLYQNLIGNLEQAKDINPSIQAIDDSAKVFATDFSAAMQQIAIEGKKQEENESEKIQLLLLISDSLTTKFLQL